jgi:glycosyltransferase involved in cell wall biosynthesis
MAAAAVLQVVTSVCAGGLSAYLLNLLRHLNRDAFTIHLSCTHFEGPHYHEAAALSASAHDLHTSRQVQKLAALYRQMRALRPRAVHAHQEPMALIAARLAGVPRRMETIHRAEYWIVDGHPLLRRVAWRCATRHLVYTRDEKSRVDPFTHAGKVQVVCPGADFARMTAHFSRGAASELLGKTVAGAETLAKAELVVGTLARLDEEKGVGYLVEAGPAIFAALDRRVSGARMLIVGDGALRPEIERRCRELEISDRVILAGYQQDGYRFLGAMDIFVLPSLAESFGFTAVEALAAQVPVICTDLPGPTSFIHAERTGLVVPPGDPSAIAAAVVRLAEDPEMRRRLAATGGREVREKYSVQAMARVYERLYEGQE